MAMDMFLKLGDLLGESEDEEFPQWIQVLAWSLSGSQSGTATVGGGVGGGKVSMGNYSFTKYTDIVSTDTWDKLCTGMHFDKIQFKARKAGGKPMIYLEMDFDTCLVTSVSTGGSAGEDQTTENVSFDFKKMKMKYIKQSKSGDPDGDKTMIYDFAKNKSET